MIKKGREEEEKKKKGEKEERRVYLNPEGCGLSCFEEEFSTDLKEWIPGFGSGTKEAKGGNSCESCRYDIYMLLPFLLCFSLPLLFADSC